jgi:hypothetical protein
MLAQDTPELIAERLDKFSGKLRCFITRLRANDLREWPLVNERVLPADVVCHTRARDLHAAPVFGRILARNLVLWVAWNRHAIQHLAEASAPGAKLTVDAPPLYDHCFFVEVCKVTLEGDV